MFVDLTEAERQRFLERGTCHIPGYTGHCPTIQFRYGTTFGASTRSVLEEMRVVLPVPKRDPPSKFDNEPPLGQRTAKTKDESYVPSVYDMFQRPYILGYTGCIPGIRFKYGSSFSQLADQSNSEFSSSLASNEKRRERERMQSVSTEPKLTSIRGRDDVTELLHHYAYLYSHSRKDRDEGCNLIPIAGYTGHIPGLKGNEASLSRRYHSAAQTGLTALYQDRQKRQQLQVAKDAVKEAITFSHAH